jgi:hypothetical protein
MTSIKSRLTWLAIVGAVFVIPLIIAKMMAPAWKIASNRVGANLPMAIDHVTVGMARSTVLSIMKVPPGDYTTTDSDYLHPPHSNAWARYEDWMFDEGRFGVRYDSSDCVIEIKHYRAVKINNRWTVARVLHLLGWDD